MVVYFTGTGNSRHIARFIASRLKDEIISANEWIRAGQRADLESPCPYVFVCPIYGWRIPPVFLSFLEEGRFAGDSRAYFVLTCGDGDGAACLELQKLCAKKGMTYQGTLRVVMPENYVALFAVPKPRTAQKIICAAEHAMEEQLPAIQERIPFASRKPGPIARFLSSVVHPLFFAVFVHDRAFYTTKACTGCGKCAALCPLHNITLDQGSPIWQGNCTHCMACICGCPQRAVEYGLFSKHRNRHYLED